MFINSISQSQPVCAFRAEVKPEIMKKRCEKLTQQYIMSPKHIIKWPENQAEKNALVDTLKNIYRILLSQDIWNTSLKVKRPDTPEEKAVLLEILNFRAQLERFTQLSHRKFEVMHDESESMTSEKRSTTLNAIEKKIEEEKKRYKGAFEFFRELDAMEEAYIENKYVKIKGLDDFWNQIRANNVNSDNNLSVKEIIDIINTPEKATAEIATVEKPVAKENNKPAREKIADDYRLLLRRYVDVYSEEEGATDKNTELARKDAIKANLNLLKKYPHLKNLLTKIFKEVEAEYSANIKLAASKEMYPLGHLWQIMEEIENIAKPAIEELKACEEVLAQNSEDKKAAKRAEYLKNKLNNLKKEWLEGLEQSVRYEKENRARAAASGAGEAYDYLVGENQNVIGQNAIMEDLKSKYGDIQLAPWTEVFSVFLN